jgi:putative transcriptional regulator
MAAIWPRRILQAFGSFLLAALLVQAVEAKLELPQTGPATLTGQLLVASPNIEDPRFQRTVILIVRHNKDGAFGIIINRPAGEVPLAGLLEALGEKDAAVQGTVKVFAGGPLQPAAGFIIHTPEYSRPGTVAVNGSLSVTSNKEIFHDIAQNTGPRKTIVAFGYAGWGANQLEAEMARKDWYTATADSGLVFDEKRERLWDVATERRLHDL